MKQDKPTIEIYVSDFIQSHLGISINKETGQIEQGQHVYASRPILPYIAEILFAKFQNKSVCYIEFPTDVSAYRTPILWAWNDWIMSSDRESRIKEYSRMERIRRFILEKNMHIIAQRLSIEWGWDYDYGLMEGLSWLSRKKPNWLLRGKERALKSIKATLIEREDQL